jgi:hypothetical protein
MDVVARPAGAHECVIEQAGDRLAGWIDGAHEVVSEGLPLGAGLFGRCLDSVSYLSTLIF